MAKYDDASWHYGGEYPQDLPIQNAATHIGMFLSWCIHHDLVSEELMADAPTEIQQVKTGDLSGAEFLLKVCNEKFTSYDLNELGQAFARDYYEGETDFGSRYSGYMDDYFDTFDEKADALGFEYETLYHIENTPANYDLLKPVIDQRFEEWQQYRQI